MEWTGFSEEDIRKLKNQSVENNARANSQTKQPIMRDLKRVSSRTKKPSKVTFAETVSYEPVDSSQRLTPTNTETRPAEPVIVVRDDQKNGPQHVVDDRAAISSSSVGMKPFTGTAASGEVLIDPDTSTAGRMSDEDCLHVNIDIDEKSIALRELGNLEKFRDQQKKIEELNRRKKEMLATALQQRQLKAKAEATKLAKIKQELDRLDLLVSVDVSVIRDKIESASRDFSEAQKRYDRIEREFIAAKIDLHKKAEVKDLLTEHLYTVIHQNELRKAQKLAELTHKLELAIEEESTDADKDAIGIAAAAMPPIPLCLVSPPTRASMSNNQSQLTSDPAPPSSAEAGDNKGPIEANNNTNTDADDSMQSNTSMVSAAESETDSSSLLTPNTCENHQQQ